MNLIISDVNVGEFNVEEGKAIKFKVENPNNAVATVEGWNNEDERVKLTIPTTLKPFEKVTAVVRIPMVDNPDSDSLDEIEDFVKLRVKFLK